MRHNCKCCGEFPRPPLLRNLEEIRAGNGYSSIKQQSGLSPATKPHGQDDDDEGQEESGNGHQRDDQIKRQFGAALVRHVFQFWNFSQVI